MGKRSLSRLPRLLAGSALICMVRGPLGWAAVVGLLLAILAPKLGFAQFDASALAPMVASLGLTPEQQLRLLNLAAQHQGNLSDPKFLGEVEAILDPAQREKVRDLIRRQAPSTKPMNPAAPRTSGTPTPGTPSAPSAAGVFSASFISGEEDRQGRVLGGTEVVALAAHQGKLYAALSVWKDNDNRRPKRGAQILVLQRAGGNWKLDRPFDPSVRTIAAMDSFSLPPDDLTPDKSKDRALLFVAPMGPRTKGNPILYREGHAAWKEVELAGHAPLQARAFALHPDRVTGETLVLVACQPGGIFRGKVNGVGSISWESRPELNDYSAMPSGFASCNGVLHVALGSALYRREDGSEPTWRRVFNPPQRSKGALRGLTAVPAPSGTGQVLLMTQDGRGGILRVDPEDKYRVVTEVAIAKLLSDQWGVKPKNVVAGRHGILAAYHPLTANAVHLIGVEARVGDGMRETVNGWERGGWIVVRRATDDYELKEVVDPSLETMPPLVSARAMAVSPFSGVENQVVYCGGYNADSGPTHDTAWIYQASIGALLPDD